MVHKKKIAPHPSCHLRFLTFVLEPRFPLFSKLIVWSHHLKFLLNPFFTLWDNYSKKFHFDQHFCPCVCIFLYSKMYLSKLQTVFVQIVKYICPNLLVYLFKLPNVFVQIKDGICLNWKMAGSSFPLWDNYSKTFAISTNTSVLALSPISTKFDLIA